MDKEKYIAEHYTTGNLLERIEEALVASGKNMGTITAEDLKGVDEFHTGGVEATEELLAQLTISKNTRVLDIGCGIGGAARHIAKNTGAIVTGFDLTPSYIDTAKSLSELVGMSEQTLFSVGSAVDMPVTDGSFDLATMFHVGMNIDDKASLFREAARVLAPNGIFALFDIMRSGQGELNFPFPWAEVADWSFVVSPDEYKDAATQAGLQLISERERRDFTLDFFARVFAAIKESGGPPAVGIHLLMKDTGAEKLHNYVAEVKAEKLAPVEMIFRKL